LSRLGLRDNAARTKGAGDPQASKDAPGQDRGIHGFISCLASKSRAALFNPRLPIGSQIVDLKSHERGGIRRNGKGLWWAAPHCNSVFGQAEPSRRVDLEAEVPGAKHPIDAEGSLFVGGRHSPKLCPFDVEAIEVRTL
jgi:hypothetical protein